MTSSRRYYEKLKSAQLATAIAFATTLLSNAGCNRGPTIPPTESVSGTVTLKGKPVGDVEVYFVSDRMVAFGKTDAQGHYDLVQGAVAGENKVYFSKIEGGNPAFQMQEGMDDYQLQMAAAAGGKKFSPPKQVIPTEYSNASAPKLNFLVPDGGTDSADFKL